MARLYGCAGRITAKTVVSGPGRWWAPAAGAAGTEDVAPAQATDTLADFGLATTAKDVSIMLNLRLLPRLLVRSNHAAL